MSRLKVSSNAHVITQYHRTIDKVTERFLGKRQIGTTGRGIGPTYADKINRVGIRIQDLFDENILRQKVEGALDQKNHLLVKVYNRRAIGVDEVVEELLSYAERLRPMVVDSSLLLHQAFEGGKYVLFEGGQATMLDVDHGTYPFVTSSNATSGGAATGSGIGPNRIDRVIGIVKAYTTRVGAGPFPTELFDESGRIPARARFRVRHHHRPPAPHAAGTTRRSPATRRASTASPTSCSPSSTCSPVSSASRCASPTTSTACATTRCRSSQSDFHHAVPIYEEFPGWTEDISGARTFDDLPKNAQDYVLALEAMIRRPHLGDRRRPGSRRDRRPPRPRRLSLSSLSRVSAGGVLVRRCAGRAR